MQHQRPSKPQQAHYIDREKKHTPFNRSLLEHGDPDFKDLRIKKPIKKKKGFFEKFFS